MPTETINIVLAGLGGQGVLKASDIAATAVLLAGRDVKKSEVHGMSQRGGSVRSDVRYGDRVGSPMVPAGEADYLVCCELAEVATFAATLRPGGTTLTPELLAGVKLPNQRCLNVALLGCLSRHLEIPEQHWRQAVMTVLDESLHQANLEAFGLGRERGLGG